MKISRFFLFAVSTFACTASSLAQLPQNPAWSEEGVQNTQKYGEQVTMEGDYNGDGYKDLAVGAPKTDSGQTNNGRVYLYLGSDTGLTDTAVWTATCDSGDAFFGGDLSYAGDVDDDGYDDLIVGASEMDSNLTDRGASFLFRGDPSGLEDTASWIAYGEQSYAFFGRSVSYSGDVNDDGYDDVIVGAYEQDSLYSDAGRAYVFHGSSTGLSDSPDWVEGIHEANAWFGRSVSYAGDVNNDGYDDVIVGAPKKGNGTDNYGRIYVYHGSNSGLPASSDFWCTPPISSDGKFGRVVTSAGDIDGDGYDDVVVGSDAGGAGGGYAAGEAWAFHGSSSGVQYVNPQEWNYSASNSYLRFGDDLINAGDVNGDGYHDLLVGATGFNSDRGKLFLFTGSDTGYASDPTSTYPGDQIQSWFGTGLGAGDVNDDGSPDLAVGANEYDGTYSDGGRSFVFMNACAEKVPSLNSTPAQPCVGDSVLLDAGSGYNSYAWSNGDSGQVLEVELMDTSMYSVQTVGDSGCVTQNDTVLAPNSLPSPQFMGLDTAYCLKDTIYQLSASPSGGSFNGPGLGSGGAFDPQNAGMGIHTISYSYTDSNGCSGTTDTNIQVVDCATSLNSHGVEEALIIRPNPSEGRVVIDHPGNSSWKLTIRDMQGKELKVFQMPSGEKRTRLDLSALPDGVHFLHFRATEGVKIRKLLLR